MLEVFNEAEHANDRGWVNCAFGIFIVKTNITARNRRFKGPTGLAYAGNRFLELPVNIGLIWIAEVQAVSNCYRLCAGANHISCRFSHGDSSAHSGIQINIPAIAVGFHG